MSVEENKALVRREQGELWNHTGNLDAAAELFAPDRVEDAKQEAANVRRGFPDLESTIEDLIAERDKVVAHWRAQATHQGEYMGIPPTGNRVNFTGISIYRIEGGKIAESWSVSDLLGMMQQLGAIARAGAGPRSLELRPSSSCPYSPECVEGEFCELRQLCPKYHSFE